MPDRTKPGSGFLFIDFQADTSNDPEVTRKKHTFIQRNFHQKLKQARLVKLKASKPPVGWAFQPLSSESPTPERQQDDDAVEVNRGHDLVRQGTLPPETWSVKQYLNASFVDPFSSSAVPMTDAMNLYWGHCARLKILAPSLTVY